ncbi:MAG: leucine-rich repeat domain-containing protein, partial [Muribaculaceae bacterium]|nr:leucine-rich repeat domain-containing protein [Muribaculaceae bacterium]
MRIFVFKSRLVWLVTMLLSCLFVSAYDFKVDGIYYNVTDMANLECEVTKGDIDYFRLDVPSTVMINNRTFTVKRIADEACYGCQDLMHVKIPNSITSIGDNAFACSALTAITIPDSVLSIGEGAFEHCSALGTVTIGNSVTDIGRNAFYQCKKLKNLKIGDSVKNIGKGAFQSCESLESVVLPNSVEFLGENAFAYCQSLSKVELSENLRVLEPGTFYSCSKLKLIIIPGSVERIVGARTLDNESQVFTDLVALSLFHSDKELVCGEYSRKYDREDNWGYDVFNEGANNLNEPYFIDGETWCRRLKSVFFNRQVKPAMRLPQVVELYFGEELKTVPITDFQKCDNLKTIVCLGTEPPVLPEGSNKQYIN